MSTVWMNGSLVAADDAHVSPFDHGLMVGDGVFETLAVARGVPFALRRHLARLRQSAATLGLDVPDDATLRTAVSDVVAANDGGRVRITVTSGPGVLGSGRDDGSPTVIVVTGPAAAWPASADVVVVPWTRNERSAVAGVKTISYAENVVALSYAHARGAGEALFLNTAGVLCEGTGSNVFVGVGGRLVTPPLSSGCLAGVTRELVLELGVAEEGDVTVEELAAADEACLTSSTRRRAADRASRRPFAAAVPRPAHREGGAGVRRPGRARPGPVTEQPEAGSWQVGGAEDGWWARERGRFLDERLAPVTRGARRVADVGCGRAEFALRAAGRLHAFVVGCDYEAYPEWGNRRGRLAFVVADVTRLPFRTAAFDVAVTLDVVEHFANDQAPLTETRRVTRPDGHVAVTVPALPQLWSAFDESVGHHRRYKSEDLAASCRRAGLSPLDVTYFFAWLVPPAWLFRKGNRLEADRARPGLLGRAVEQAVGVVCALERWWLRRARLPFGTSLWSLSRR